jgi:hypothetical protein
MKSIYLDGVAVINVDNLLMAKFEEDYVVDRETKQGAWVPIGVRMVFRDNVWVTLHDGDLALVGLTPKTFLAMIQKTMGEV